MLPTLELRNFWYATGISILVPIAYAIINLSQIRRKSTMLGVPSYAMLNKIFPLSQKNKFFKPFASVFFWSIVEIVFITICQYIPLPYLARGFAQLVGTGANFFGFLYFCPLILMVVFIILWAEPMKNMDFFTLSVPIVLALNKVGCFCAGCCNSIWWPGGVYNYNTEREEFPIQLVEAACGVLIFIFLLVYRKKAKHRKNGELYPLFMILYSGLRFVSEFWRGQKLVWGPFRYYHLFCAIGFVLGLIAFILVRKYSDRIAQYFDNRIYFSRKLKQKQLEKEALKS